MSSLVLKLIAVVTMFIDHMTASCFGVWGISNIRVPILDMSLYMLGRTIGRTAFLIYCFQLAEGVRFTRDWRKYALRLGLLALISELPFDFGLHGLRLLPGQLRQGSLAESIDWRHQNVYFTLLLGMLCLAFAKITREALHRYGEMASAEKAGNIRLRLAGLHLLRYMLWAGLAFFAGYAAKHWGHTDYGMGGVVMINIIGLTGEYWEDFIPAMPRWVINVVFCALGLWACCSILNSSLEKYAAFALIPIAFYNGRKGYSSRKLQAAFYLFYPAHLMLLGFLRAMAQ